MAQTDTRPGFRLPWTAEHGAQTDQAEPMASETADATSAQAPDAEAPAEGSTVADQSTADEASTLPQEPETSDMIDATATTSTRRPTKFMAELSRAMQTAVETSRDETMARLAADAKTVVEEIHAASAGEAAELRRHADDDVAAVREWSKAEIARIREETEARIALRKTALDGEMDQHGLIVESRVQQVGATVAAFEAEMAAFFERLSTEQDPTRIAAMAERMPEPPDLAGVAAAIVEPITASTAPNETLVDDEPAVESDGSEMTESEASAETGETTESGESAESETGDAESFETGHAEGEAEASTPDFAAAEAEAAAFTGDVEDDASEANEPTPAPKHDPESAAAALAATADDSPPQGERATTRVMVTGLVSVASIATFKRSLGRVPGVSTIGVASGPDGEFVFTVSHDSGIRLGDAIVALPGFEAQVTAESSGGLEVAAHDPDAGS
jgi:hypothetical protein